MQIVVAVAGLVVSVLAGIAVLGSYQYFEGNFLALRHNHLLRADNTESMQSLSWKTGSIRTDIASNAIITSVGNTKKHFSNVSSRDILAVATAAGDVDFGELRTMILQIREFSGAVSIVVFDLGLSESEKKDLQMFNFVHVREVSLLKRCSTPLKSQLVYSILSDYDVIVWVDIGNLPIWDFRRLLDDFSVGTAFVGRFSGTELPKEATYQKEMRSLYPEHSRARAVSTRFFAMFVDFRFYSRVLLPWMQCSAEITCPTGLANYASMLPQNFACESRDDALLSYLLAAFEGQRPGSVVLMTIANSTMLPKRTGALFGPPRIPRIGDWGAGPPAEPIFACVPLFGPNNQIVMLLHAAWLAEKIGARILIPPIRSHYLRTDRDGVSQDPSLLPAEDVFSAHFLYRRAILVDDSSPVAGLLSVLDIIPFFSTPRAHLDRNRTYTVAYLLKRRYIGAFLANIGAGHVPEARVRVIACAGKPFACVRATLAAGRVPLLVQNTVHIFRAHKGTNPLFRAGPFRVPRPILARGLRHPRACLAVHLRLNDNVVREAASRGASVLNTSAGRLLRGSRWPGLSLEGVVDAVRRAAVRRGLGLYVMMPFHRPLFEHLAREGVATVQDYDVAGLAELEVTLVDMGLGAICEVLVPDAVTYTHARTHERARARTHTHAHAHAHTHPRTTRAVRARIHTHFWLIVLLICIFVFYAL